jgi:hypothetical protein
MAGKETNEEIYERYLEDSESLDFDELNAALN